MVTPPRAVARNGVCIQIRCGDALFGAWIARYVAGLDLQVESRTPITLLIDRRHGYAMRTLEGMLEAERAEAVVVTDNPCPEHMKDIWALGQGAFVESGFVLRQDPATALRELLGRLAVGRPFLYWTGPRTTLTPAERATLKLVACGRHNKEIAQRLCVAESTVKKRLGAVYGKLGAPNHVAAAAYYWGGAFRRAADGEHASRDARHRDGGSMRGRRGSLRAG